MPALSELPPTARLILRPIHPPLAPEAAAALVQAIDKLFAQFTREDRISTHAAEVLADGGVLAVAFVDDTPLSGCSHDKLAQVLTAYETRTGSKLLDAPPIMVEVDGRPTCVDRIGLKALIAAGRVDANTIHWDLRADSVGAWLEHGRRPARETWLAPLIERFLVARASPPWYPPPQNQEARAPPRPTEDDMVKRPGRFKRPKYTLAEDYQHVITPIGVVHSPFQWREEAPRQATVGDAVEATIVLKTGLQNTVKDLKGFDRVWVLFGFCYSNGWKHQIVPPRDTVKRGILATRSPDRPNGLGLSAVQLVSIDGPRIVIRGCDILNGSPVYDLKPYIAQYDSFPEAKAGWVDALVNPGSDHRYRAGCSPEERAAKDAEKS